MCSHWYDSTQDSGGSNPRSPVLEADALTTGPTEGWNRAARHQITSIFVDFFFFFLNFLSDFFEERICSGYCACGHTAIEIADRSMLTPGQPVQELILSCQVPGGAASALPMCSHWYDSTRVRGGWIPGSSVLEANALTTGPTEEWNRAAGHQITSRFLDFLKTFFRIFFFFFFLATDLLRILCVRPH